MIRFILRRKMRDNRSGLDRQDLLTIDADAPELQAALDTGGFDENGYQSTFLLGAEILRDAPEASPASVNEDMLAALREIAADIDNDAVPGWQIYQKAIAAIAMATESPDASNTKG